MITANIGHVKGRGVANQSSVYQIGFECKESLNDAACTRDRVIVLLRLGYKL